MTTIDKLQRNLMAGRITILTYELGLHKAFGKGEITRPEYMTLLTNTTKLSRANRDNTGEAAFRSHLQSIQAR